MHIFTQYCIREKLSDEKDLVNTGRKYYSVFRVASYKFLVRKVQLLLPRSLFVATYVFRRLPCRHHCLTYYGARHKNFNINGALTMT